MDKKIIEIEMTWAIKLRNGEVDKQSARQSVREEVYGYLLQIGAMEAAMTWKWKLAFGC